MSTGPSMVTKLFSFRGRINRIGFASTISLALIGSVFLLTAITILSLVLRRVGITSIADGINALGWPVAIGALLLYFWPAAALCVKRTRDIGAPVLLLPVWVLISVVDGMLTHHDGHSWIVAALNIVVTALLFGWPGKDTDDAFPPATDAVQKA